MEYFLFGMWFGAAIVLIVDWWLGNVPEGYEDEDGYHDGTEPNSYVVKSQRGDEYLVTIKRGKIHPNE